MAVLIFKSEILLFNSKKPLFAWTPTDVLAFAIYDFAGRLIGFYGFKHGKKATGNGFIVILNNFIDRIFLHFFAFQF
jgi:hypothetical protein